MVVRKPTGLKKGGQGLPGYFVGVSPWMCHHSIRKPAQGFSTELASAKGPFLFVARLPGEIWGSNGTSWVVYRDPYNGLV